MKFSYNNNEINFNGEKKKYILLNVFINIYLNNY